MTPLLRSPLVTCLAVALTAGCSRTPASGPVEPSEAPAANELVLSATAQQRAGLNVANARRASLTQRVTAPGVIALDEARTARIGSLQEGLVLDIHADVGTRVRTGQVLATMHGHAVHDAWAGYRKAVADRRRSERELAYAEDANGRAQRLYTSKSISLQDRQRADLEAVAAKEQLAIADAEVRRAIEELEHVGIIVDGTPPPDGAATREQIPVRTPIGGVILERLVTPGTTVTPGTSMFVVSDLSRLWAVAEVDESNLSRLNVGGPVSVTVAAYPGMTFAGTVAYIADMVNPKTRRITVRATLPNGDGRLKPEMFASITLSGGEPRTAVVVPADAVQAIDGRDVVFVAEAGNRFVARTVQTGEISDEGVEIVWGVSATDRLVTTGSFVLKTELLRVRGEAGE